MKNLSRKKFGDCDSNVMEKPVLFFLLIFNSIMFAQDYNGIDLSLIFKTNIGAFLLYNQVNKQYYKYNIVRCRKRFLPASTFKIPNSLIGLEAKVIQDSDYVIKWDGKPKLIKV